MVCKGPQGIRPFNKPTAKGVFVFVAIEKVGSGMFIYFRNRANPVMFSPIIIINMPANTAIPAIKLMDRDNTEPSAPTTPPSTV